MKFNTENISCKKLNGQQNCQLSIWFIGRFEGMLLHGSVFPWVCGRLYLSLITSTASTPRAPHPCLLLPNFDHIIEVAASNLSHQAKRNIQYILLEVTWLQIKEWDSSNGSHNWADSTSLAGARHYAYTYLSVCKLSNHYDFHAAVLERLELKTTKMQTSG